MSGAGPTDDSSIADDVPLYRRVHPDQTVQDDNLGRRRPSSAAYKPNAQVDETSISVNIAEDPALALADTMRHGEGFSVYALASREVRAEGLGIKRDPETDNKTHGLVFGFPHNAKREKICKKFAKQATLVHDASPDEPKTL